MAACSYIARAEGLPKFRDTNYSQKNTRAKEEGERII